MQSPLRFLAGFVLLTLWAVPAVLAADAPPKRVVVCTFTAGFRHSSIPEGEKMLSEIAATTGAFEVVDWVRNPDIRVPSKPTPPRALPPSAGEKQQADFAKATAAYEAALARWTPADEAGATAAKARLAVEIRTAFEKLSPAALTANRIDAVVFLNTTGDLPLPDIEGFAHWIESGHAFVGIHSASDTLKRSRPYLDMLQGCFQVHGPQVKAVLIAGDRDHPANAGIGAGWTLAQEEIYHITAHDPAKARVLWFMRHDPNKPEVAGYYPLSWVRLAGQGRVFYTAVGHREDLYNLDPTLRGRINPVETAKQFRAHVTGGILWALGLAAGDATPNPEIK